MIPDYIDGPSNTLLSVIHDNNEKAPTNWNGFRELTEKWLTDKKKIINLCKQNIISILLK